MLLGFIPTYGADVTEVHAGTDPDSTKVTVNGFMSYESGGIEYRILDASNVEIYCIYDNELSIVNIPQTVTIESRTYTVKKIGDAAFIILM